MRKGVVAVDDDAAPADGDSEATPLLPLLPQWDRRVVKREMKSWHPRFHSCH